MRDPGEATPASDLIIHQTEDGKTRIQCRLEEENLWLSQAQIGELYQKDVKTINEHLLNIYKEKELAEISTIRKFRIVRIEGKREVAREISHYSIQAILAVGFRVRSQRGTQFRQQAALCRDRPDGSRDHRSARQPRAPQHGPHQLERSTGYQKRCEGGQELSQES